MCIKPERYLHFGYSSEYPGGGCYVSEDRRAYETAGVHSGRHGSISKISGYVFKWKRISRSGKRPEVSS